MRASILAFVDNLSAGRALGVLATILAFVDRFAAGFAFGRVLAFVLALVNGLATG